MANKIIDSKAANTAVGMAMAPVFIALSVPVAIALTAAIPFVAVGSLYKWMRRSGATPPPPPPPPRP